MTNKPIDEGRLAYNYPEVARLIGAGINTVRKAVAEGQLDTLKLGRRVLITRASVERLMARAGAR